MSEHSFCPICDLDLRPPWEREDFDGVGSLGAALSLEHFDYVRWRARHEDHMHLMDSPAVMRLRGEFFREMKPLREILEEKA